MALNQRYFDSRWLLCLLLYIALTVSSSPVDTKNQGDYTNLSDAFWQLTDLNPEPTLFNKHINPLEGGQNFTHCCLIAINSSLEVINGSVVKKPPDFIRASVEELLEATANDQFPCTAQWNGDFKGAPVVEVPARWMDSTCPGWQLSDSRKGHESQWILPLVGFLLPAIIFCLTIPRRRKLAVWKKLFFPDLSQVISWILAPFAMIAALFCVITDTVIWLSICFACAGPMLLSGLYEAYLDNILIGFIMEKTNNYRLTLDMRARLLFIILVGNLDLEPEVRNGDAELVGISNREREDDRWPNYQGTAFRNPSSPWTHIENLVHPLRSYRDSTTGTPRQWPLHDATCLVPNCKNLKCKEVPLERDAYVTKEIGRTKTRLRTMLACQYSFGATVGAAVVFFLGTLVFTIIATLANLGDDDTSQALAFGMWYMIIPHVSIVSGLLLAGNNPNTLEGVVALELGHVEEEPSFERKHFGTNLFELVYDSRYKPQWLWLRGKSKSEWVQKVCSTYQFRPPSGRQGNFVLDEDIVGLRRATTLSIMNWSVVLSLTLLLMGVPFSLAFLTSFFTPVVGLSCRSFTFLIYAISQISQIVLWLWAFAGSPRQGKRFKFLRIGGILDRYGFYSPTNVSSLKSRKTFFSVKSIWALVWYNLAAIFGLGGILTSIGRTMMQLMGVYSSSKCAITSGYWTKPHDDVQIVISSNYASQIAAANIYWKTCAITAVVFLGVVSFCGWWYQRRLRGLFRMLVNDIGDSTTDREDIKAGVSVSVSRAAEV